ncbi:hypothetical protein HDV01_002961 [Terramyces sp. JEL0728]|nr:hypothetical protein HDV01_002961 [Terramyces sp. JEL0728]
MDLLNLPSELQFKIINYLNLYDIPYISLACKYYYKLLISCQAISNLVEYDSRNVYLNNELNYGSHLDSANQDNTKLYLEKLKLFKNSIFKFANFYLGPTPFSILHDYLPAAYNINLQLIFDSTTQINWKGIGESSLRKITNVQITDVYLPGTLKYLVGMAGLKKLSVESDVYEFEEDMDILRDWTSFIDILPQLCIKTLEISRNAALSLFPSPFSYQLPKTNLTTLSLKKCNINDDMVMGMSKVLPGCTIINLDLEENVITDIGAKALAEALSDCNLVTLNLSYNRIAVSGLKRLSESLKLSKLKKFDIMYNSFKEHYLHILIENLPNTLLETFSIHELSKKAEEALINNISKSNLKELCIPLSMKNLGRFMQATKNSKVKTIEFEFGDDVDTQVEILGRHLKDTTVDTIFLTDDCDDPEIKITNCLAIFEGQDKNTSLTELHISEFEFTGSDIEKISNQLKNTNLKYLGCCCSNLNDEDLLKLIPGVVASDIKILDFNFSCKSYTTTDGIFRFVEGVKDSLQELKFAPNVWPFPKEDYRTLRNILGDNPKLKVTVQKQKEDRLRI